MPRNVEIKAALDDASATRQIIEGLADQGPIELLQTDTFFRCLTGRLKLREFEGAPAELIYYQRPDASGPSESVYFVTPISDPVTTRQILEVSNGGLGVVKKRRLLYLIGPTRVHLDQVEGLGHFMELEVVLQADQSTAEGIAVAEALMTRLEIDSGQLVDTAYFDLLHR